jgi:hypothetical protein
MASIGPIICKWRTWISFFAVAFICGCDPYHLSQTTIWHNDSAHADGQRLLPSDEAKVLYAVDDVALHHSLKPASYTDAQRVLARDYWGHYPLGHTEQARAVRLTCFLPSDGSARIEIGEFLAWGESAYAKSLRQDLEQELKTELGSSANISSEINWTGPADPKESK